MLAAAPTHADFGLQACGEQFPDNELANVPTIGRTATDTPAGDNVQICQRYD